MWPFKKKKTRSQLLAECSSQELLDYVFASDDEINMTTYRLLSLVERIEFNDIFSNNSVRPNELKDALKKSLHSIGITKAMDGIGNCLVVSDGPNRDKGIVIEGSEWREILIKQGQLAHKKELEDRGLFPGVRKIKCNVS